MISDLRNAVVGLDGSDESRHAFEWACRQAGDGIVVGIHAFSPASSLFASSVMIDLGPVRARRGDLLRHDWATAPSGSTATITATIVDDDVVSALTHAAADRSAAVVVGHAHGSHVLGHVARRVLRSSGQPVVIVPSDATIEPIAAEMVVVAVHGTPAANRETVEFGARLAMHHGAQLHLVSVFASSLSSPPAAPVSGYGFGDVQIEPITRRHPPPDVVDELVRDAARRWPELHVSGTTLSGHPVTALADSAAAVAAQVVIVGNHHHSALTSLITDAVLQRLPSHVSCPVIAVPSRPDVGRRS